MSSAESTGRLPSDVDRLEGVLLGTALGDALGLPYEGLSLARVATYASRLDRFRLVGRTGFVSDDTEQTALLAQALVREPDDAERCARAFGASLAWWLARLPFGIGLATLRACVRRALGFARSGVRSAGNGAAMRAAIVGVFFSDDRPARRRFGRAVATVTHTDERAVQAALYVAELAGLCARASPDTSRVALARRALAVVEHAELASALERALGLARAGAPVSEAVARLGHGGFVLESVPLATYCFVIAGESALSAIRAAILAGGDTDTNAAIVGGWMGALHGARALPTGLVQRLHDGPFGPTHLRALAVALTRRSSAPPWSWSAALVRNLALFPVVLAHGVLRLVPRASAPAPCEPRAESQRSVSSRGS